MKAERAHEPSVADKAALPAPDRLAALRAVLARIEERLGKGKVRRGSELARGLQGRA